MTLKMFVKKIRSYFLLGAIVGLSMGLSAQEISTSTSESAVIQKASKVIDAWHLAAADADFDQYFSLMTNKGVFVGTDATEHWENKAFKSFSKPYFSAGKAWSFTSLERHIYHNDRAVWFDELLDTQMGICRGSGVLELEDGQWKIAHYVLSIAVPNDHVSSLLELKKAQDSISIMRLKGLKQ
jgi:hypothetical protein